MKKALCVVLAASAMLLTACFGGENTAQYNDVRLPAEVTAEMLVPSFWTDSRSAEKTVLNADEIAALNRATYAALYDGEITNLDNRLNDLNDFGATVSGEFVRSLISCYKVPDTGYFKNGTAATAADIAQLEQSRNLDTIAETVEVRYGVCTARISARTLPTTDFYSEDAEDRFYDSLQQAELYANDPVVILHTSADGKWLYTMSSAFGGWIPAERAAVFSSRDEWLAWQTPDDFLIVTGADMHLQEDPYVPQLSGMTFAMGTKLPLAPESEIPAEISKRASFCNHVVKLPVRGEDGMMEPEYALVPVSADVHKGYLTYTHAAVVQQAFEMLGNRYGWGGMLGSTDCSGLMVAVYRCFGIVLPRNSSSQALLPTASHDVKDMSTEKKESLLKKTPPGSILFFPGHIMMYLGEEDGNFYVISSTGSFIPEDAADGEIQEVGSIVINTLNVKRANGKTWLACLEKIKMIEPADDNK